MECVDVISPGDFSDKIEHSGSSYDVLFKEFDSYSLHDVKNNDHVRLDGKHTNDLTLRINNCNFNKLTIKNCDKVVIDDCNLKNDGFDSVLKIFNCENVVIKNSVLKYKPSDRNHSELTIEEEGLEIVNSDQVKVVDSCVKGYGIAFSCKGTELEIKNVLIKNSYYVFKGIDSGFEVYNSVAEDFHNIMSGSSDLGSCEIKDITDSPDFVELALERL